MLAKSSAITYDSVRHEEVGRNLMEPFVRVGKITASVKY